MKERRGANRSCAVTNVCNNSAGQCGVVRLRGHRESAGEGPFACAGSKALPVLRRPEFRSELQQESLCCCRHVSVNSGAHRCSPLQF